MQLQQLLLFPGGVGRERQHSTQRHVHAHIPVKNGKAAIGRPLQCGFNTSVLSPPPMESSPCDAKEERLHISTYHYSSSS